MTKRERESESENYDSGLKENHMNDEQRVGVFTLNLYLYTTYAPAATAAKITVITQTATQVAFASLALLPANFPFRCYQMILLDGSHGIQPKPPSYY